MRAAAHLSTKAAGIVKALMAESAVLVEAAGREIGVTSPDKVFFPERGETKLELVNYYLDKAIEEPLMRAMGGRPVLLQRFPNGASGPSFFQKRVPESRPGSRRPSFRRRMASRTRRLRLGKPTTDAAAGVRQRFGR